MHSAQNLNHSFTENSGIIAFFLAEFLWKKISLTRNFWILVNPSMRMCFSIVKLYFCVVFRFTVQNKNT